jgi:hypothetical protein
MVTAQAPAVIFLWDTQPSLHSANVNVVSSKYNSITDLNYTSLDQGQ